MKKSLLETNPYLKDPEQRKRLMRNSVLSSSAIEGILVKFDEASGQFVHEDTETSNS